MLGWFKKKFRKDSQEQSEIGAPIVDGDDTEVVEEEISAGDAEAEAPQATDETAEVEENVEKEAGSSLDEDTQATDELAESFPENEPEQAQEQYPEIREDFLISDFADAPEEHQDQSETQPVQDVSDQETDNVERTTEEDGQTESEAERDDKPLHDESPSDKLDPLLDEMLEAAEDSFQLPSVNKQPKAEELSLDFDFGVTRIDADELEFVEDLKQTPEPKIGETTGEDVTVIATEDLEFIDTKTEPEEQGEISEEILRDIFPAPPPSEQDKPQRLSMFLRLQERLGKTRDSFVHKLDALFLGKKEIDQELLDDLEEILITADLGVATTMELLDTARDKVKRNELSDPQALKGVLREKILSFLQESDQPAELVMPETGPFVIMVVGVNGVGKTTTIGKIASKFVESGQSVLLVAGDTFRAAAIDQLKIWGDRVGVEVVSGEPGCDPSSVVFDGVAKGVAEDVDVVLIDTAGRLHTSVNLMEELKKIRRVIGKNLETAPHEVMLVLDATTGQNAISQAKFFNEAVHVTGLAVTKLDGTAKGGIVANVCRELKIPVRFIGIGEQVDDLRDFDPEEFVQALFSQNEEEKAEA